MSEKFSQKIETDDFLQKMKGFAFKRFSYKKRMSFVESGIFSWKIKNIRLNQQNTIKHFINF